MDLNQQDMIFRPLMKKKEGTADSYFQLHNSYFVNQKIAQVKGTSLTKSGISKFYDVSSIQLSEDKKILSIQLKQRSQKLPDELSDQRFYGIKDTQANENKQIVDKIKQYYTENQIRASKGITIKSYWQKLFKDYNMEQQVNKVCEELDGQPFALYILGVNSTKAGAGLSKIVYSNTYFKLLGRNIIQEAIKMSQSKSLEDYQTNHNYGQQVARVAQYCIKRMTCYDNNQVREDLKNVLQIQKELILQNGEKQMYVMSVECRSPFLYCINFRKPDPKKPAVGLEVQQVGQKIAEKEAGFRQAPKKSNNIEIISKTESD